MVATYISSSSDVNYFGHHVHFLYLRDRYPIRHEPGWISSRHHAKLSAWSWGFPSSCWLLGYLEPRRRGSSTSQRIAKRLEANARTPIATPVYMAMPGAERMYSQPSRLNICPRLGKGRRHTEAKKAQVRFEKDDASEHTVEIRIPWR